MLSFLDIPIVGSPPVGWQFAVFSTGPHRKKGDSSSSGTLGYRHNKQTHVDSKEVKVRSEWSSAQGDENTPNLILEAGSNSEPQGQEPIHPPSSPTKATTDPDNGTLVGASRSTRNQDSESDANHSRAWSDSDVSRETVANSDMESASGDCIMCSDTDEVTVRTACKKYRKRVQTYCSLDKGSLWSEVQAKQIWNSCHAMWTHDHEIIRTEQDCALEEDHNSFEMLKMMVRTDQLLWIAEVMNLKIYTQESEVKAHSQAKTWVFSLKHYHAHYYWLYEKGTTRGMVGLQGLHSSDAFRPFNVSSSVGLKLYCPWCFKLGGNTGTIATHLSEVHYRLAIVCDLCKLFTSMSA